MKTSRIISITPQFSRKRIDVYLKQQLRRLEAAVLSRLQRVGETFITNARNTNTYKDVTGNLRSSIGYVILRDGVQISQSFPGDKPEGVAKAKRYSRQIAGRHAHGFVIICVAGMDYAAAVESVGKDVITGSSLIAKEPLQRAFRDLQNRIN